MLWQLKRVLILLTVHKDYAKPYYTMQIARILQAKEENATVPITG
jgi:hypothetical protein